MTRSAPRPPLTSSAPGPPSIRSLPRPPDDPIVPAQPDDRVVPVATADHVPTRACPEGRRCRSCPRSCTRTGRRARAAERRPRSERSSTRGCRRRPPRDGTGHSSVPPVSTIPWICSTISALASVVTSPSGSATRDVSEEPAHDLARSRFREVGREDEAVWSRDLADLVSDVLPQLGRDGMVAFELALQRDERDDRLA